MMTAGPMEVGHREGSGEACRAGDQRPQQDTVPALAQEPERPGQRRIADPGLVAHVTVPRHTPHGSPVLCSAMLLIFSE